MAEQRVDIVKLTPDVASEWLATSVLNRRIRDAVVDRYAREMRAGDWHLSPDAIAFDDGGHLSNGHHRCHSVIASGVTVEVLVVHGGVSMLDSLLTTDAGISRKLSDVLTMMGEVNTPTLAAAIRTYHGLITDTLRSKGGTKYTLTLREAMNVLNEHPNMRESVRVASHVRQALHVAAGQWAGLLYAFATIDNDDHDAFVVALIDGDNLKGDDPRWLLREVCINNHMRTGKLPAWRMAALIIKAWNAFRDGDTMKQLTFKAGGATPERFPVPH